MYTRMVRAFVGIGSVDTVVAPDSALVGLGVSGPVATPLAAACLPLQVHDLRRVSVIFRQDRLQAMLRDRVDTSTRRSLPFTKQYPVRSLPRALHLAKVSIYWQWVTDSSQVYLHTNLVYACIKENLQALALGSNTATVVHVVCVLENKLFLYISFIHCYVQVYAGPFKLIYVLTMATYNYLLSPQSA